MTFEVERFQDLVNIEEKYSGRNEAFQVRPLSQLKKYRISIELTELLDHMN